MLTEEISADETKIFLENNSKFLIDVEQCFFSRQNKAFSIGATDKIIMPCCIAKFLLVMEDLPFLRAYTLSVVCNSKEF